jgi:hypothetical protein
MAGSASYVHEPIEFNSQLGGTMPAGKNRIPKPAMVIDRATAEACIAIAQKVARGRQLVDDPSGSSVAAQVARLIQKELLDAQNTSNK